MDADRFDALSRALSTTPSRRGTLRLLAGSALAGLLSRGVAETDAHNKLEKCRKIEDKDKRKRCRKKARRHNRQHANEPSPPCVPEAPATTCAGRCGRRTNNCGQAVTCLVCPAGQVCLVNGSCAVPCTDPDTCPGVCFCGDPSTEGSRYCTEGNSVCDVHATCASTAACPLGEQCAPCGGTTRCLPLCRS